MCIPKNRMDSHSVRIWIALIDAAKDISNVIVIFYTPASQHLLYMFHLFLNFKHSAFGVFLLAFPLLLIASSIYCCITSYCNSYV